MTLALTGILNAYVRLPLDQVFGTTYGTLVLAKAAALVVLGVLAPCTAAGPWPTPRPGGHRPCCASAGSRCC